MTEPGDSGKYGLITRDREGRPRFEWFDDPASYRDRLATLEDPNHSGLSIDELAGLLDR